MKALIIQTGIIDDNDNPQGWLFDCLGVVPAIEIHADGERLWGGYTIDELRAIAESRIAPLTNS